MHPDICVVYHYQIFQTLEEYRLPVCSQDI